VVYRHENCCQGKVILGKQEGLKKGEEEGKIKQAIKSYL